MRPSGRHTLPLAGPAAGEPNYDDSTPQLSPALERRVGSGAGIPCGPTQLDTWSSPAAGQSLSARFTGIAEAIRPDTLLGAAAGHIRRPEEGFEKLEVQTSSTWR